MADLLTLIVYSFAGGLVSLVGAGLILIAKSKILSRVNELAGFVAGVLMTVALVDLLPEAIGEISARDLGYLILAGIIFLFIMEKSHFWFHHHHEPHGKVPTIAGVWLGDLLHNFIDGLAIGSAFLVNKNLGIATAIGVGLHELPKEMADFTLYIKAGMSQTTMIGLNLLASVFSVFGALSIFYFGHIVEGVQFYLIPVTIGMFLYIALADMVPEIHEDKSIRNQMKSLFWFVLGVTVAILSVG